MIKTFVDRPVVALLGQSDSGKSTLFNGLTGLRQHVGNRLGKTVEQKEGYHNRNGIRYTAMDLPGTYSLSANSDEEIITRDYIAGEKADVACILADASQLERSLLVLTDLTGIRMSALLLLNMMDVAAEQGKTVGVGMLEERLGTPVASFTVNDAKNYGGFYEALDRVLRERSVLGTGLLERKYMDTEHFPEVCRLTSENDIGDYSGLWLAAKVVERDVPVIVKVKELLDEKDRTELDGLLLEISHGAPPIGQCKFVWIDCILKGVVEGKKRTTSLGAFDRAAISRRRGKPLAVIIVLLGLVTSFIPAMPFMMGGSLLSSVPTPALIHVLEAVRTPGILIRLVCSVGVNALYFAIFTIGFVFGITLAFGLIEEIGYTVRTFYVLDQTMAKLGLQGKATMPFLVSLGHIIGGAVDTRVIGNWGQRILIIALAWVVSHAATWAIVPVMSNVFFESWASLVIVVILVMALVYMWITSKVFGRYPIKGERTGLTMELPSYHRSRWGSLFRYVFGRTKDVSVRVLKVILMISLIFWLLSHTSDGNVKRSVIYRAGTFIEPATHIFGSSWQTFLAFVSSAVSKEAVLGVLGSLYAGTDTIFASTVGGTEQAANLGEILTANTGRAEALAFIFAVISSIPCIVAVAPTYQETHSVK